MSVTSPSTRLASLAFEIASSNSAPAEAHLLPPGPFRAVDGRPLECEAWQLDASIAAVVIARMAAQKNDTLIDYEHQSLRSANNGQPVPAAGWFHEMAWRDADGLYAINVAWTTNATAMIAAKEYRYISAVFMYDMVSGNVEEIVSVALTNTPALDGLDALDMAALSKKFNQTEREFMADKSLAELTVENVTLNHNVTALTAERDSLKTVVAALTSERDALKEKFVALEEEKKQAALVEETAKKTALLTEALSKGQLAPALKPWAEKLSLADLTEYFSHSGVTALTKTQAQGNDKGNGVGALTKEQKTIAKKMGVSEEEYLKTQNELNGGVDG